MDVACANVEKGWLGWLGWKRLVRWFVGKIGWVEGFFGELKKIITFAALLKICKMAYGEFYDLEVWKEARMFRKAISAIARRFPPEEKFSLANQIKRSSRSITANIAESHGRFHKGEAIQFIRHSRGSLKETLDHLFCALDELYITEEQFETMKVHYERCLRLINGYINYHESR